MSIIKSDQINEIAAALAKAQGDIKGAIKDSANPFFKSTYADLEAIWDACRTQLSKNGLAVIQTTGIDDKGAMVLYTTLGHSSGQYISGTYPINPIKNDPQAMGSAITYARRYALAAMVGVHQTDDDGNAASGKQQYPQPEPKNVQAAPMKSGNAQIEPHDHKWSPSQYKKGTEYCTICKDVRSSS